MGVLKIMDLLLFRVCVGATAVLETPTSLAMIFWESPCRLHCGYTTPRMQDTLTPTIRGLFEIKSHENTPPAAGVYVTPVAAFHPRFHRIST